MKQALKNVITLALSLILCPCIILARLEKIFSREEGVFQFFAQLLSLVPGVPGSYLRKAYYRFTLKRCSLTSHIDFGTFFPHRDTEIGQRVIIGAYCVVGCAKLEDDVMLASRVSITSGKNTHQNESGAITHEHYFRKVTIGSRTWIGEGSVVLANVGSDSVVSAGSVVTKDAPPNITAVGNPARFIPRAQQLVASTVAEVVPAS